MRRHEMKRVALLAAVTFWVSAGVTSAATPLTVGSGWHPFLTLQGTGGIPPESPFTFTASAPTLVTVTDILCVGDRFTISDGPTTLGTTSVPGPLDCRVPDTGDPDVALADPNYSHGKFALSSGTHSVGIVHSAAPFGGGSGYIRVDLMTGHDCASGGWATITVSPSFTSESDCTTFVSAHMSTKRISRGDAEAVFNANPGREAIILRSPTLQGAPDIQNARIGPFGAANGRHFCSLDWHVLGVNISEGPGGHAQMSALLNQLDVTIMLDGAPFPLLAAAVKRADPKFALEVFGLEDAWGKMFGGLLAPDALGVGTHTTSIVFVDPSTGEVDTGSATFFIDAPSTGACA
jgi:hypothetical protein